MNTDTPFTARHCFASAGRSLLRAFALTGRGILLGLRHLFTRHPNATWLAICVAVAVWLGVKVGQARSERDRYSAANAQLIERIDSINAINASRQ